MNTEIIVTLNRVGTLHDLDPITEVIAESLVAQGYGNDPDINNDEAEVKSIISVRPLFLEDEDDINEWVGLLAETSEIIVMPLTSPIDEEEKTDE